MTEKGRKERIHSRSIRVDSFETDEGTLVVEGSLTDERFFPYRLYTANETREPGKVHHMKATMTLSIPQMEILAIRAEMPVVPVDECRTIQETAQKLEGMRIRAGFTNEVRAVLGKRSGCLHLTHLIMVMSSAAVQGIWTVQSRLREGIPAPPPDVDPAMLMDSCWLWRGDGPLMERFRRTKAQNKT